MHKKIAVVFNRMIVGGAEKSLLNFLTAIDREKFEITLFTLNDQGAYFDQIPKDVIIKYTECKNTKELLIEDIKTFRWSSVFKVMVYRILIRLSRDSYKRFTYSLMCYPKFPERYDCAISYKFGYEDSATTLVRINADKKCAFLHSSPDNVKKQISAGSIFDKIFIVSAGSKQQFDNKYPWLAKKTQVFYNLIDSSDIIKKSEEEISDMSFKENDMVIVTVGRLSKEKGQNLIPQTVKLLLNAGYNIKWYLIGDGELKEKIEQQISELEIENSLILLGTKNNPYPYMKACDIYAQTSLSEGFGLTVMEAKILCKPIVTTDAGVMTEQIQNGENGIIVSETTPQALYDGIKTLLNHPELRQKFSVALQDETFDTSTEMQKLYEFIENTEGNET